MLHAQNMGGLKTLCLSLTLAGLASTARADDGLLRHVYECVGRLSAQIEHHWMFQDKSSDLIERQRSLMVDILEALTTPENAGEVLSGRIDAKLGHASLLNRATFASDPRIKSMAANRVIRDLRACDGIALETPAPKLAGSIPVSGPAPDRQTMNQTAVQIRR